MGYSHLSLDLLNHVCVELFYNFNELICNVFLFSVGKTDQRQPLSVLNEGLVERGYIGFLH